MGKNDSIEIVVSSDEPIGHYQVQLAFAGFHWTVAEDDATGTEWSRTLEVKDYTKFGVGLYQVRAVSSGGTACEGAVLIRVTGSPFATIAGWAGVLLAGAGIGATAFVGLRRRGVPILPMAVGALGGVGVLGLLQQFAVAYPTRVLGDRQRCDRPPDPLGVQQIGNLSGGGAAAAATSGGGAAASAPAAAMTPGWVADTVVGPNGVSAWAGPEAGSAPSQALNPGVELRLISRSGERVLVECANGWRTWVDAAAIGQANP